MEHWDSQGHQLYVTLGTIELLISAVNSMVYLFQTVFGLMNSICEKTYVYGVIKLACPSNFIFFYEYIYQRIDLNNYYISFSHLLSVWLHQTRIGLSLYDVAGQGYLRESVSINLLS